MTRNPQLDDTQINTLPGWVNDRVNPWVKDFGNRQVLGQLAVDGKSNEITAVPKLLEMQALPSMVVAADAMHCQRQQSQQVLEQRTDYVLALKGNQESLHDDVRLFLEDPATPVAKDSQINKGHERIETRTASIRSDVGWLQETHQWPALAAVGKITASPAMLETTPVWRAATTC